MDLVNAVLNFMGMNHGSHPRFHSSHFSSLEAPEKERMPILRAVLIFHRPCKESFCLQRLLDAVAGLAATSGHTKVSPILSSDCFSSLLLI